MRLNKKKLAALAMSAVMAASTMPFSVLAEEFTDMSEANVAVEQAAGDVVETTFEFDEVNHTVVFTYPDGTTSEPVAAFLGTVQPLKCGQNEIKEWRAEDPRSGKTIAVSNQFVTQYATDHTWDVNTYWITTNEASCGHDGTKTQYHKCTTCGKEEPVKDFSGNNITQTIPAPTHTYGSTYTVVGETHNLDSNLQLINKNEDGWYKLQTWHKCTSCSFAEMLDEETIDVLCDATAEVSYYTVELRDGSNIQTGQFNRSYTDLSRLPADSAIKLLDCSKNGEYWIVAYHTRGGSTTDAVVYTEKHVVPAHHCSDISIKDAYKYPTLKVVTENGVKRVKNLSCSKPVTYVEQTYCTAEDKYISTESKTAQPEGTHSNATKGKDSSIVGSVSYIKANTTDGYISESVYNVLTNSYNATTNNYKVTVTGDCAEEVTIKVTYLCDECKEELSDSITVKCKELQHIWSNPEKVNVVEPTCFAAGSYDTVKTCTVCGKQETVRTGIAIPATGKHSFKDEKTGAIDYTDAHIKFSGTKVVDKEGANVSRKGQTYDATNALYSVSAASVIKCETCGEEIAQAPAVTLTVVDVKKETEKEAGSITLKATWYTTDKKVKLEDTCTVPYFSNVAAYLDRNPDKDPINGLHKDDDGVWRYYENNEVTDFTGIAEYQGGEFFVANGVLCSKASGLNLYNGEWYFLAGGQIQTQVTGLAMYNGEWFFLTNGKLDRSKTGLVEYDGAKFIIAKGELQRYSGLWQDPADGTWYFAALGQIQEQYTGTAIYDGQTFELVNGKLVR